MYELQAMPMPLPYGSLRLFWSQPENLFFQSRAFDNFVDALAQTHAADAQVIRRHRIRFDQMLAAHLRRIEFQLFGDLVELNFQRITRLRRSVSALWTTRRFVCKRAQSLKLVTRHVISHRLQRAGVERARDAVTAVSAAVEDTTESASR